MGNKFVGHQAQPPPFLVPPRRGGGITQGPLEPGDEVAVDQFETRQRGCGFKSSGGEKEEDKFAGGTVFRDDATGYLRVYFQVSLGAEETIRNKHMFEREALSFRVSVKRYRTDNGIFTKEDFLREVATSNQLLTTASGVGAHHQNGVAERSIHTLVTRACTIFLHAQLRWPDQTSIDLWPMAMQHANYLENIVRKVNDGLTAEEKLARSFQGTNRLTNLPVWGCPTYVLQPTLQEGKKLPKWQPRS